MFSRRSILTTLPLAGVAACTAAGVTPATVPVLATDVELVANGFTPVVAALATAPSVPANVAKQAQTYLATIQADAAAIAKATLNPPAGTVQEFVQVVQALAAVAVTIPAVAPYAVVVQAAVALLPVILVQAGIKVTGITTAMTPVQARAILALAKQ